MAKATYQSIEYGLCGNKVIHPNKLQLRLYWSTLLELMESGDYSKEEIADMMIYVKDFDMYGIEPDLTGRDRGFKGMWRRFMKEAEILTASFIKTTLARQQSGSKGGTAKANKKKHPEHDDIEESP